MGHIPVPETVLRAMGWNTVTVQVYVWNWKVYTWSQVYTWNWGVREWPESAVGTRKGKPEDGMVARHYPLQRTKNGNDRK